MAHQVLARKWRPRKFADVVGQEHVVQALANALQTGRIHHAYLFTGTRGVGKTTLARILAKALNCVGPDGTGGMTPTPCGVCSACTEIDAGRFVDLLEVDAATNTKVDEMRELLETAQYAPVSGRYKVYIIDEVHMLSKSAFNAMLKTLEEPPAHVEFILATTDPQKLPITVLSRCLQFNLRNLPPALLANHLASILDVEKVEYQVPALEMIGRAGEGSARDALSLLDQAIAYGAGKVTTEQVSTMLGALDQTFLFSLLTHVASRDGAALVAEIEGIASRSISFELTLKELSSLIARVALAKTVETWDVGAVDAEKIRLLAERFAVEDLQVVYQIALLGRRDLHLAPDEQLGFTMTMLRMLSMLSARKSNTSMRAPSVNSTSAPAPVPASQAAVAPPWHHESPPGEVVASDGVPAPGAELSRATWPAFVARLNLTGMAGMLAKQCEFQSFVNGVLELSVPESQKHLADRKYQEKLRGELVPVLGDALRMAVKVGATQGASLAATEDRTRDLQQKAAVASIEQDPFVKNLRSDFGVEIDHNAIRPAH